MRVGVGRGGEHNREKQVYFIVGDTKAQRREVTSGGEAGLQAPTTVLPPLYRPLLFPLLYKEYLCHLCPGPRTLTFSTPHFQLSVAKLKCPPVPPLGHPPLWFPHSPRVHQASFLPGPPIPCWGPAASDWQLVKFVKFASSPNPFER